jgi:DNA gyrase/topoisomerase IV subunit B
VVAHSNTFDEIFETPARRYVPSMKKHDYDESKIKTLSSLEHIRTRTGMYIGRLGDGTHYDDGIYVLLKEVVDNGIDEFIMGFGRQIDISIDGDIIRVRDYGRGIPLGKVIDCVSRINTGAKYNDDVFQFSIGLNGVGTKAVNALSSSFTVSSYRDGQFFRANFERGKLKSQRKGQQAETNGTEIVFQPDRTIFKNFRFRDEHIIRRLRLYTFLNAGLKIAYNGTVYSSENGLKDLLTEMSQERLSIRSSITGKGQSRLRLPTQTASQRTTTRLSTANTPPTVERI